MSGMITDPQRLTQDATEQLRGRLPERDVDLFVLRLARYAPDLLEGFATLYGSHQAGQGCLDRVLAMMTERYRQRGADLKFLDLQRQVAPDWLQKPRQIGYVLYVDRFAGTLDRVASHLDHLTALGVTYVHLMPLLKTRPGNSDGGYAVVDHRVVEPALGTMHELETLARVFRHSGISLCIDLVLNHVAREHAWARAALEGDPHYQDYFWFFPDRALPDQYEQTLPEVFPDFAPGSFTWEESLSCWVWTTFNDFQWDLNWSNPEVLTEFVDLILTLANRGVEILRLDAIAFLGKRLGTDCQNQPEVHAIVQTLRAIAGVVAPAVAFKAEAIVGPEQLVHYLGTGKYHGKLADMAYHNSLMVQIWSSLASRDVGLMNRALTRIPAKPTSTAWGTYLRCHDDIGWAISDVDAGDVGLDGAAHRSFLANYYEGRFPGSHAHGAVFQPNPRTADRRTCGTTASLAGLEQALAIGDEELTSLSIERILLGHAVILTFPGVPLIYMGDEVGLLNDYEYRQDPAREGDNRWMHRPQMPWDQVARRFQHHTVEHRLFSGLRILIEARKRLPQLHAATAVEVVALDNPHLFACARPHPEGTLLGVFNFSEDSQEVALPPHTSSFDQISGAVVRGIRGGYALAPYGRYWLA